MKKSIFSLFLLLLLKSTMANSVLVKLFNNSNATIHCTNLRIQNGSFGIRDHGNPFYGKEYGPGSHLELNTGSASAFCGTDGYVEFQTQVNNKTYQILISFDNPFIGSNEFFASASPPFQIRHLNGGSGSDMVISFELSGGPTPTPTPVAPSPIVISNAGSKTITGKISWNINDTGWPPSDDLTKAFEISIKAPTLFVVDGSGKASATYQNQRGWFEQVKELNNISIKFTDRQKERPAQLQSAPNPLSPLRTVSFQITNLPDGIPLVISAKPTNNQWIKGKNIPESNKPYTKWIAFLNEKNNNGSNVQYEVVAAWFDAGGNYAGNATGNIPDEWLKQLKNLRPKSDFGGHQTDLSRRPLSSPIKNNSFKKQETIMQNPAQQPVNRPVQQTIRSRNQFSNK